MKKKYLLFLILFSASFFEIKAQKTIAVLTGSNWTFFTDFSTALNQCATGSTIYLPGGLFILSQNLDTIDKQIIIIGVGHYPDSTLATSRTVLQGSLTFLNGGNSCIIIGVSLDGINANSNCNNLTIFRSRLQSINLTNFTNVKIDECVVTGNVISDNTISNNVIISKSYIENVYQIKAAVLENNIIALLGPSSCYSFYNMSDLLLSNNVIINSNFACISSSSFANNLFFNTTNLGSNTSISNQFGTNFASTFANVPNIGFSYNYDYHLLPSSVGHNFGTDGTDVGIYGTAYPYKQSAVPSNPHISFKSISPSSAPNGTLPVNIRVIAQDR